MAETITRSRVAVSAALLLYSVAIVIFAAYPTEDIDWAEWIAMILGAVSIVGLIAHMIPSVTVPGEEYAYLVTGWAGFFTLLLYLIDVNTAPDYEQWRNSVLLLTGVVGGYGAFWAEESTRG